MAAKKKAAPKKAEPTTARVRLRANVPATYLQAPGEPRDYAAPFVGAGEVREVPAAVADRLAARGHAEPA